MLVEFTRRSMRRSRVFLKITPDLLHQAAKQPQQLAGLSAISRPEEAQREASGAGLATPARAGIDFARRRPLRPQEGPRPDNTEPTWLAGTDLLPQPCLLCLNWSRRVANTSAARPADDSKKFSRAGAVHAGSRAQAIEGAPGRLRPGQAAIFSNLSAGSGRRGGSLPVSWRFCAASGRYARWSGQPAAWYLGVDKGLTKGLTGKPATVKRGEWRAVILLAAKALVVSRWCRP